MTVSRFKCHALHCRAKCNICINVSRSYRMRVQLLLRRSGRVMTTSAEFEIVRQIKEQCCYVAYNPQKEEENKSLQKRQYQLPDGSVVEVSGWARSLDLPLFS